MQCVTNAIKAIAVLLVTRFAIKDKLAAKFGTVTCIAFGISITVADLFFFFCNGGFRNSIPDYSGSFVYAWSNWEYFTGFIAGVIMTAALLMIKPAEDTHELAFANVPEKVRKAFIFIGGFAVIGVNIIRPAILRFDTTDSSTIVGAVIGVAIAAVVIGLLIKFAGINAEKISMDAFSRVMLLFFVTFITVFYFFICTEEYRNINELNALHTILMAISAVTCIAWSTKEAIKAKNA